MISAVDRSGKRVLVCDDERHIVRLLQANLERRGYTVTCAYGGREAIERLGKEPFDLAVIDRDIPGISGLEVLAWIRANESTKDLRVAMLDKERHEDDPPGRTASANLWLRISSTRERPQTSSVRTG